MPPHQKCLFFLCYSQKMCICCVFLITVPPTHLVIEKFWDFNDCTNMMIVLSSLQPKVTKNAGTVKKNSLRVKIWFFFMEIFLEKDLQNWGPLIKFNWSIFVLGDVFLLFFSPIVLPVTNCSAPARIWTVSYCFVSKTAFLGSDY